MFYQGDLQSGISLALEHDKHIVCFVTDGGEESNKWEHEWLQDHNIPQLLETRAVTLKMQAGSVEAGYLTAFCPITTIPTIIVIHKGKVGNQISSGIDKNAFTLHLLRATSRGLAGANSPNPQTASGQASSNTNPNADVLPTHFDQSSATSSTQAPTEQPSTDETIVPPISVTQSQTSQEIQQPNSSPSDIPSNPPQEQAPLSQNIQHLLRDRRARLEAEGQVQDEADHARRLEKGKARAQDAENPESVPAARRDQASYAHQQVQRKKEAQLEKERVLRLVENDKLERREREERRRVIAGAETNANEKATPTAVPQVPVVGSADGQSCALRIMLLDGSALRTTFPADKTLRTTVRPWIDKHRTDGSTPFTFKQLLTPLPSRPILSADEDQSLQSLGLVPNATLVLVLVQGYTTAYGGRRGFLAVIYGYILSFFVAASRYMRSLGIGTDAARATAPAPSAASVRELRGAKDVGRSSGVPPGPSIRIRTLRERERDGERKDGAEDERPQLYNGNQLNFEPNRELDEEVD